MKISKQEAVFLLSFAESNKECDVDCLGSSVCPAHLRGLSARQVKKIWNGIIKKLKIVTKGTQRGQA